MVEMAHGVDKPFEERQDMVCWLAVGGGIFGRTEVGSSERMCLG